MVRSLVRLAFGASVVATAASSIAAAAPPSLAVLDGAPDAFFMGRALPTSLLVGSFGGGSGGALGRAPHGWFLGVDTGLARWLSFDATVARGDIVPPGPPNNGWAFGVRGGYQLRSGLALQLRFDDLGVATSRDSGSLLAASGGLRYSVPFMIMPFADVLLGGMFGGIDMAPAASVGVGVSVPVARHAALDLTVRDWIADVGGSVRHIPAVMAGINLGFGG